MVKKKKRGLTIKINLTNRWLYTFIAIGILAIISVGVYAWANPTTGVGHDLSEIEPCAAGKILQTNADGTAWNCVTMPIGNLKTKVIEIGFWNMDSYETKTVSHGLTGSKIRSVAVIIRNDDGNNRYTFPIGYSITDGENAGWIARIDNTHIVMLARRGGMFDGVNFDLMGFNRGWITIWYEE